MQCTDFHVSSKYKADVKKFYNIGLRSVITKMSLLLNNVWIGQALLKMTCILYFKRVMIIMTVACTILIYDPSKANLV